MNMTMESRRKAFKGEAERSWTKTENLAVLTFLHHSDLLSLARNPEDLALMRGRENVKKEMVRIAEERNQVLSHMVVESQLEREFQNMVRDFFDAIKEMATKMMLKEMREAEEKRKLEQQKNTPETNLSKTDEKTPTKLSAKDKIKKIMKEKMVKKREKKAKKGGRNNSRTRSANKSFNSSVNLSSKREEGKRQHKTWKWSKVRKFVEKKPNLKVLEEMIRQRHVGQNEALEKIFMRKKLEYVKYHDENYKKYLRFILEQIGLGIQKFNRKLYRKSEEKSKMGQTEIDSIREEKESGSEDKQRAEHKTQHKKSGETNTAIPEEIPVRLEIEMENPYCVISRNVQSKCLFLLKLSPDNSTQSTGKANLQRTTQGVSLNMREKSLRKIEIPKTKRESFGLGLLKPLGLKRVFSEAPKNPKPQRTGVSLHTADNRLEQWLRAFKQWQGGDLRRNKDVQSNRCDYLFSVKSFLKISEPLDLRLLQKCMFRASQRARQRIDGLRLGLEVTKVFREWDDEPSQGRLAKSLGLRMFKRRGLNMNLNRSDKKAIVEEVEIEETARRHKKSYERGGLFKSVHGPPPSFFKNKEKEEENKKKKEKKINNKNEKEDLVESENDSLEAKPEMKTPKIFKVKTTGAEQFGQHGEYSPSLRHIKMPEQPVIKGILMDQLPLVASCFSELTLFENIACANIEVKEELADLSIEYFHHLRREVEDIVKQINDTDMLRILEVELADLGYTMDSSSVPTVGTLIGRLFKRNTWTGQETQTRNILNQSDLSFFESKFANLLKKLLLIFLELAALSNAGLFWSRIKPQLRKDPELARSFWRFLETSIEVGLFAQSLSTLSAQFSGISTLAGRVFRLVLYVHGSARKYLKGDLKLLKGVISVTLRELGVSHVDPYLLQQLIFSKVNDSSSATKLSFLFKALERELKEGLLGLNNKKKRKRYAKNRDLAESRVEVSERKGHQDSWSRIESQSHSSRKFSENLTDPLASERKALGQSELRLDTLHSMTEVASQNIKESADSLRLGTLDAVLRLVLVTCHNSRILQLATRCLSLMSQARAGGLEWGSEELLSKLCFQKSSALILKPNKQEHSIDTPKTQLSERKNSTYDFRQYSIPGTNLMMNLMDRRDVYASDDYSKMKEIRFEGERCDLLYLIERVGEQIGLGRGSHQSIMTESRVLQSARKAKIKKNTRITVSKSGEGQTQLESMKGKEVKANEPKDKKDPKDKDNKDTDVKDAKPENEDQTKPTSEKEKKSPSVEAKDKPETKNTPKEPKHPSALGLKERFRIDEEIARVRKVNDNYAVFIHLGDEIDMSFMIRILFFWADRCGGLDTTLPTTFEGVKSLIENKVKETPAKKKTDTGSSSTNQSKRKRSKGELQERLFQSLPKLKFLDQGRFEGNLGWFLNGDNIYDAFNLKVPKIRENISKNIRIKWKLKNLMKLKKDFEDMLLAMVVPMYLLKDPEEEAAEELKREETRKEEEKQRKNKEAKEREIMRLEGFLKTKAMSEEIIDELLVNAGKEDEKKETVKEIVKETTNVPVQENDPKIIKDNTDEITQETSKENKEEKPKETKEETTKKTIVKTSKELNKEIAKEIIELVSSDSESDTSSEESDDEENVRRLETIIDSIEKSEVEEKEIRLPPNFSLM